MPVIFFLKVSGSWGRNIVFFFYEAKWSLPITVLQPGQDCVVFTSSCFDRFIQIKGAKATAQ